MKPIDLANLLIESTPEARHSLLGTHQSLPAVEIAESLQQICYEIWTDDPQRVGRIVETLYAIVDRTKNIEVRGYAEWTAAIEALVDGDLEGCIGLIDTSDATFSSIGKPHLAAKTQTSKLYALAQLGRYDEALDCGHQAREVFLAYDDQFSAGKIETNLGNLFWRRDL